MSQGSKVLFDIDTIVFSKRDDSHLRLENIDGAQCIMKNEDVMICFQASVEEMLNFTDAKLIRGYGQTPQDDELPSMSIRFEFPNISITSTPVENNFAMVITLNKLENGEIDGTIETAE